jgi:hypothetical protein
LSKLIPLPAPDSLKGNIPTFPETNQFLPHPAIFDYNRHAKGLLPHFGFDLDDKVLHSFEGGNK